MKYAVHVVDADDHASYEANAEKAAKEPAHVWAIGVITRKTSHGVYVASQGAKFRSEPVEGAEQTSLMYIRRPYKARRVAEVEL